MAYAKPDQLESRGEFKPIPLDEAMDVQMAESARQIDWSAVARYLQHLIANTPTGDDPTGERGEYPGWDGY